MTENNWKWLVGMLRNKRVWDGTRLLIPGPIMDYIWVNILSALCKDFSAWCWMCLVPVTVIIKTRASGILWHMNFHAVPRNSPFATEFTACSGKRGVAHYCYIYSNSRFFRLIINFTIYKTIKSSTCKLSFMIVRTWCALMILLFIWTNILCHCGKLRTPCKIRYCPDLDWYSAT